MKEVFEHWIPNMEKRVWYLLIGYTVSLSGSGMTESFLVIYLHQIRRMDLAVSGGIIAFAGVAGVIAIPISGWIGDRFGSGRSLVILLIVSAIGEAAMAFVQGPMSAFTASFFIGAGAAGSWNALSSILAVSVRSNRRNDVFGMAFGLQNLGFGFGAAVGGWILDSHSSLSFTIIFMLDAASFLFFAVFAGFRLPDSNRRRGIMGRAVGSAGRTGYSAVFKDQALILIMILYACLAIIMGGLKTTAFPQWVTVHSPTWVIGMAFWANSCVIVGGQPFALRLLRGKRRTRVASVAALLVGIGCLLIFFSGIIGGGPTMITGFILALAVVGFGETLLFSSLPALVNNLAADSLRGRYNSMFNLSWQAGSIAGPPLSGWMLAHHWGRGLFFLFIGVSGLLAIFSPLLGRVVPTSVNRG
ncbi:MAG TPA: MFS transporter [Bacillales bacterium]